MCEAVRKPDVLHMIYFAKTEGERMFQGTIPQAARDIIFEAAQHWGADRIAVACSGNFTIERVLYAAG